MNGTLKIESILSLLSGLGGTEDDMEKVMQIEHIFRKLNPKENQDG